jgi:hypothetical protein
MLRTPSNLMGNGVNIIPAMLFWGRSTLYAGRADISVLRVELKTRQNCHDNDKR